jgi:hypothetical protein
VRVDMAGSFLEVGPCSQAPIRSCSGLLMLPSEMLKD